MKDYVDVMVDPTPNPNSYKFTLDRPVVQQGSKSYMAPEQAKGDPLAEKLFEIPGVKSLFFLNNFITVSRDPAVDWNEIAGEVVNVIQGHFEQA